MQIDINFIFFFFKNLIISAIVVWGIGNLNFFVLSQFPIQLWVIPFSFSILFFVIHKLFFDKSPIISIIIISMSLTIFNILDSFSLHCDNSIQQNFLFQLLDFLANCFVSICIIMSYWGKLNKIDKIMIFVILLLIILSMNFMNYGIFRIFNLIF